MRVSRAITSSDRSVIVGANSSPAQISLQKVSLTFGAGGGGLEVLRDISLDVRPSEIVTLIGPSGSGKSTILNIISDTLSVGGMHRSGEVKINWRSKARNRLGYVFQKDTLLPWRTLIQNVEVGLEIAGVSKNERRARAHEWIARLGLASFEDAYPHTLSGGMRQRANIIRTLICCPEIVLMDEPFGALDAQTRLVLQQLLIDLWREFKPTICFVTHDIEESILLGDRVVLLGARPGQIQAIYEVDEPHPREIIEFKSSHRFQSLYSKVWNDLKSSLPAHSLAREQLK